MHADEIRFLVDDSDAANARILDAARRLTPEAFVGTPPGRGGASLRDTLVHTLDPERSWREGWRSRGEDGGRTSTRRRSPTSRRWPAPGVPTRGGCRPWLAALEDAEMGVPAADGCPLWRCLAHVVNRGTQHRSDAAMVLTHRGHSAGEHDLIFSPHVRGATPDARIGPSSES